MNLPLRNVLAVALLLATPWTAVLPGGGETQPASGAPTLLILVRHAEKTAGGPDPSLSPAGEERARELARVLADVPVDALYSSQFRRTALTLEPLRSHTGLEIRTDPVQRDVEAWAVDFAARLLTEHSGQTVVIAGHSNTVPVLMRALGATGVEKLDESDYDDLFWIVRAGDQVAWVRQHYGAVTD